MLRYGLAGAIQRPRYPASRVSGSSPIVSVGTHSKLSPRWSRAPFVNRCVRFFGLKSPTIPITALTPDTIVACARHDPGSCSADLVALDRRLIERQAQARPARHHEPAAFEGRRLLVEPERPRHVLHGEAVGDGGGQVGVDLGNEVA